MRYNTYENGGAIESLVTIAGMTVTGYFRLRNGPVGDMEAASKEYVDSLVVTPGSEPAQQGTFSKGRLPAFTGGKVTSVAGDSVLTLTTSGILPGDHTKITVGANGLITSGAPLTASDISSVNFNRITTGKPTTLDGYGITDGVSRVDGSITGNLTLNANPVINTDVATKQYTDNKPLAGKVYQTGDLLIGGYDVPPTGFLRCNGGEVSKTTYAALYSIVSGQPGGDSTMNSGKPWKQQYAFNTAQSSDITGWTVGTPLLEPLHSSQAIVTKNRVYLLSGVIVSRTSNVYTAPINSDGTLGTWTIDTPLPGALTNSQAIVTKNRVYLLGGWSSGGVDTVYTAPINEDGTLGTWTTDTPLLQRVGYSQAIVTKNRVHLLGGQRGGITYLSTVQTAPINEDGTLGTWTAGTSLPVPLGSSQAIVTKNRVYLLSGQNSESSPSTVFTAPINADGTLGEWTTDTSLPGFFHTSQAIVTNSRVYLLGGHGNSGTKGTVYTAPINEDGTLGTWTTGTSLPGILRGSQAIVTNSRVYLLGGFGISTVSTVYTAPFAGGMNDYSSYYGVSPEADTGTDFRLPDYTSTTDPIGKVFVKF